MIKTFKYTLIPSIIIGFVMWLGSASLSFYKIMSETTNRSLQNEQAIKEILIDVKDLHKENNEMLKLLINLPQVRQGNSDKAK